MADATKSTQQGTPRSDVLSQSQPATSEEVEARAHRPTTVTPRRESDPFDQSNEANPEDLAERAD